MFSDAKLSDDRLYRYTLERVWDSTKPILGFIMLNPSTADASSNDPTVRTCIAIAERWGYGGISVRNLFAYRATKPMAMMSYHRPVGEDNDKYLRAMLDRIGTIVLAWGGKGGYISRDAEVLSLIEKARPDFKGIVCLGMTNSHQPVHPLGTAGSIRLIPWSERANKSG